MKNVLSEKLNAKFGSKKWRRMKYLMIAMPFLVYFIMFSYLPLIGWAYAFFEYKIGVPFYRFDLMEFKGFDYFIELLTDKELGRVLQNTLAISGIGLLLSPMPVIFAILINDIKSQKGKRFVQTVTTFPNFISWVIVYGLATAFFSANGLLSQIQKALGMDTYIFGLLGEKDKTWMLMVVLGLWKSMGWSAILYLAAITGVDQEVYDAAKVDGANKVQLIRYVILPVILPTYFVLLLMSISNLLNKGFEQYYVFWNPLVADKIEVLDYYIYKVGMKYGRYSFSVAAGIVKSIIGIVLLFLANAGAKKVRGNSIV